MTDKVTLTQLANLQNQTTAVNAINNNSNAITAAMDNTLSRDGTAPNQMLSNLDMNANRIINLPAPVSNTEPMRVMDAATLNGGGTITVSPLPSGGSTGQVLEKNSSTNFDVSWQTIGQVPIGGTTGTVLTKNSNTNFDTGWSTSVTSVGLTLPADFTVSGSPVTTIGTLAGAWATTPTGSGAMVRANNPVIVSPTISSINNGGTLTLPSGPDTILSATNSATLTNKSMSTGQLTGILQAAQFPALTGDVTTPGGALNSTIALNAVSNAKMAVMPAFTLKANSLGATGTPTDMDVTALTVKSSPVAGDIVLIQDSAASNAFKQTTAGALATVGSVSSVGGLTGAVGLGSGLSVAVSGNNISEDTTMIGEIRWFPMSRPPNTNYKLCDGSTQSRSTFATLFANLNHSATLTFTTSSSSVTWTAHGLSVTDVVKIYTTGTMPTNFTAATAGTGGTVYYVQSVVNANTITLSATPGGSAITCGASIGTGTITGVNSFWGDGDGSTTFNLPDLRGEFIRTWDANKGTDPGSTGTKRAIGVYDHQVDIFASHNHTATPNISSWVQAGGASFNGGASGGSPSTLSVAIGSTGGSETRPKNFAINAFIRML